MSDHRKDDSMRRRGVLGALAAGTAAATIGVAAASSGSSAKAAGGYVPADELKAWIDAHTVPAPPTSSPSPSPSASATAVPGAKFTANFFDRTQWVSGRTSSYPGRTNPNDNKLDYLDTAWPSKPGAFAASRRSDGTWLADLLTTEGSQKAFRVRAGDTINTVFTLPTSAQGSWPAVWTWKDGGSEIDVFEWHPDNPDLLELSNHVRGGGFYYRSPSIGPGKQVTMAVTCGAESVVWKVNGHTVYADGNGVGSGWSAYLIVNLSVCAGHYHPAPSVATSSLAWSVQSLTVT